MKFGLSEDQQLLRDSYARFFDTESSLRRVRAAMAAGGFDAPLWRGLAELGTFGMRVPAAVGGLELGTHDATIMMEEAGRMLASGPLAEALLAARLLATLGAAAQQNLLREVLAGGKVVTLAYHDLTTAPRQWLAGGAAADAAIARQGDAVVLVSLAADDRQPEPSLASSGIAEVDLARAPQSVLARGPVATSEFARALEEWKLLSAAALAGLAREAVRLASAYASERHAFGAPIGSYQALSHPLADLITDIEGGKHYTWKVIHAIAAGEADAGAHIPLALWWNARTAARAGIHALRTFGGYGLTTEYDIHLYNLRAKAWPLAYGDPERWLAQAGRRLYAGERCELPEVGTTSIDFDLGDDARALFRETDEFFRRNLTPEISAKAHYSWDGHHPLIHRKLAEANLLFPAWPKSKGGRGASPYARHAAAAAWEEHGWSGHAAGTTYMVAAMIDRFGSEQLQREVLQPILRGECVCSLGYTEPGCGSDVFAAQCRATRDGEGWRIDGTKMFTSGANLAAYVLLLTRTNPDVPKHKGLTTFIVPMNAPGISIQPVHTFQDERTNITFYDGVKVPDSYRLGEVDGGVKTMSAGLEMEHGGGGFVKVQHALVRAAEQLCRELQHDGRPLLADRGAQLRLARATAHHQIAEMLSLRALWSAEERLKLPAAGPMSKLFSSEKFLADASDLLDLTAPLSLSKRAGPAAFVNQCYRHAHGTTIYAGTSEIHRSMIAERALGLPRSRG